MLGPASLSSTRSTQLSFRNHDIYFPSQSHLKPILLLLWGIWVSAVGEITAYASSELLVLYRPSRRDVKPHSPHSLNLLICAGSLNPTKGFAALRGQRVLGGLGEEGRGPGQPPCIHHKDTLQEEDFLIRVSQSLLHPALPSGLCKPPGPSHTDTRAGATDEAAGRRSSPLPAAGICTLSSSRRVVADSA